MKPTRFLLPATLTLLFAASAWWSARLATRYQRQLQGQPATAARFEHQIQQLRRQRDTVRQRLETASQQPAPVATSPTTPDALPDLAQATEVERWVRHTKRFKQAFERRPDQKIPELSLLNDLHWLRIARRVKFDTEDDLDRAMALMRNKAREFCTQFLQRALTAYVKENHGRLPLDTSELGPYCDLPLDPALLAQYEMVGAGGQGDASPGTIMKLKSLVDEDYDDRISFQRGEGDSFTYSTGSHQDPAKPRDEGSPDHQLNAQLEYDLTIAVRAFVAKNRGALPKSPAELIPYFDPPLGPALTETLSVPMTPEQQNQFPAEIAKLATRRRLPP